jgi:peptide/nickel transport system substrate-binding protein
MTGRHSNTNTTRRGITRRSILRTLGTGAAFLGTGALLPRGRGWWHAAQPAHAAAAGGDLGTLIVGGVALFRTLDPGRTIEVNGMSIEKACYDTLVTFYGEDLRTPRPLLAASWRTSADGRTFTFGLRPGVHFASGNQLTSADVKWSFDRILNLKANTLFLFDGVEGVDAPDPSTVVIRTKAAKPDLIPILSHPGLSVLDSRLMLQNGADAGPEAKDRDHAEQYLFQHSAGSGPFALQSYTPSQELILVRNRSYWGPAPRLDRIVLRHVPDPVTQALQVVRGDIDVASSIGPDQEEPLRRVQSVVVRATPSATTFYILMNNNPDVGGPFSNPKVQQAVRYGLDYDGIMKIAGPGAARLAGVIPTLMPGSLPSSEAPKQDLARARALLKESGLAEVKGKFQYSSDAIQFGVPTSLIAQKIQSDLARVGIALALDGLPNVTSLTLYRAGKDQFGVWGWAADYPDASDFLVYAPGRVVGKRAGWLPGASPAAQQLASLADRAEAEPDNHKRITMLQQFEHLLAQAGPYVPLFQPAIPFAHRSNVEGVAYNSVWALDLAAIRKTA